MRFEGRTDVNDSHFVCLIDMIDVFVDRCGIGSSISSRVADLLTHYTDLFR
jgi:hypothetical protein